MDKTHYQQDYDVEQRGAKLKQKSNSIQLVSDQEDSDRKSAKFTEEENGICRISLGQRNSIFISETAKFARANFKSAAAQDIAEAVYRGVELILRDVAKEDPRFRCSEILKVGSFSEGTKILDPDEFDFLVVIEELSQPGAITLVTKDIPPGYTVVLLANETLKERWNHTAESGILHNFQEVEHPPSFGSIVLSVLRKMAEIQLADYDLSECGYISFEESPLTVPSESHITLKLKYAEVWNPNVMLTFQHGTMAINVDLSPAIRYYNVSDCFKAEDCIDEQLAKAVLDRGSILLVNHKTWDTPDADHTNKHIFRITFTETEVYFIKDMRQDHKEIFVFLKYISYIFQKFSASFKTGNANPRLPTYLLKMGCLLHDRLCKVPNSANINYCLYDILPIMLSWYESGQYRSIFNTKLRVCKSLIIRDYEKLFAFLFDYCMHKIEAPDITEPNFNPTPFIESKFREIYTSKNVPLQNKKEDFLSVLGNLLLLSNKPEEVMKEIESKTTPPKWQTLFSE